MIDSKKFLQFRSERSLDFNQDRNLHFDFERSLMFDFRRKLLFDHVRDLSFGKHGPVFRGYACPRCSYLIHPMERECRSCGTRVRIVKKSELEHLPSHDLARSARADDKALAPCPSCGTKIPQDSEHCPRCRANVPEWRRYLEDLRKWQDMVQHSGSLEGGSRPSSTQSDEWYRRQ